jgi:quercetin dioxygenase-like cupin family protein
MKRKHLHPADAMRTHGYRKAAIGLLGLLACSFAHAQDEPAGFARALPDALKWAPNPAAPDAQIAVLLGSPGKAEPYVVRAKFPDGYRIMPHTHPDQRTYTVLSGTWYLGFGDKFDQTKLKAYPAGSAYVLPANTPHFQLTKGETVIQMNAVGPAGVTFLNPADDPRKK